ncbi:uncharacterized protein [Physcomitrium patens]|uniref:3'-5' exonuclease domain-containing protein n=1 Tax=Physcomitrium patens TaxID=3218 RepID=A0A7I4A824_PHYPA|nr:uncharacterized protein LOC112288502 isoform X2 [Physcomitrium patens]|eukprot:XP_024388476.1 uncharacterized protein LOC112288502 isoform X2 [Physcomitrella patens]
METGVLLESTNGEQTDDSSFWKLLIPRERILFVDSPRTEEFEVFLIALEEAMIVAMDAEWKPVRRAGVSPRVSIMQISCRIRKESKAWTAMEKILFARKIRAEAEESLSAEKSIVERQREELENQRLELEMEREKMQEEVEKEKRKVRMEWKNLKRERAEKKKRDRKEREEMLKEARNAKQQHHEETHVDNRSTLTKLEDGLKYLILGRNGEICELADDLSGCDQKSAEEGVTPKNVTTGDPEQNVDNLLEVLAQAQKELMKHDEGEQPAEHTEAKLAKLSKDDSRDAESNYIFPENENVLKKDGLRSKDTEVEENRVNRNFDGNRSSQGNDIERSRQPSDDTGETESRSPKMQVSEIGADVGRADDQITSVSDGEDDPDIDHEFSDAGEDEFEMDVQDIKVVEEIESVPVLPRRTDEWKGEELTPEESEFITGEEVIFVLDLLALSAADFAFPLKTMLCSPRILKLGFAFKQDQLHLSASFPGPEANGCFDKVEPYIDIAKLYKEFLHVNFSNLKHKGKRFVLGGTHSLTAISKAVLGHPLCKDAQCSNWEQRPLSQDQILYAAADTHCLLALFDTLLSDAFALISPAPTLVEAGDKAGSMIQQRASSLREFREPGLKLFTGKIRETVPATPAGYIFSPRMGSATEMVEAALRPSPPSSPLEPVGTVKQETSSERYAKFVKKYSERLLVNEESRSRSRARRPRARRARESLKNPDDALNLDWVGPAPWDVRIGGDGTPKFLCDVMVEGLARQLRCVGVDAASSPTKKSDPRQLVEQATREGRILLTKDIKLLRRRLMPDNLSYFVKKSGKWEQLEEVMEVFQITVSESELLSRCVKCNGEFTPRPLTSIEAKAQAPATQDIPTSVLETCEEYWQCSMCGHLFWQLHYFFRERLRSLIHSADNLEGTASAP